MQLTTLKHAIMRLDALQTDLSELMEADLDEKEMEIISEAIETSGAMEAALVSLVKKYTDEEEFLQESITIPDLDEYPEG